MMLFFIAISTYSLLMPPLPLAVLSCPIRLSYLLIKSVS